ncbi:hypothetical protein [Ramlibacter pallidus]|uniref:MFS transporter n=1 Tax=Ramlibacter pallidus TaxID=2780087 RepID=A0ABR9S7U8_9BURK|nr:hypothetical protein [Ramlibacter pallidus]MBE7369560.1 hypothetical protein [Ramlibacter pallidus]
MTAVSAAALIQVYGALACGAVLASIVIALAWDEPGLARPRAQAAASA